MIAHVLALVLWFLTLQDAAPRFTPETGATLGKLAGQLPVEIAVCLALEDGRLGDWAIAGTPTPLAVQGRILCDTEHDDAIWHSHPVLLLSNPRWQRYFLEARGRAGRTPSDLCYLTVGDVRTVRPYLYRWIIVGVDEDTWCWWTLEQVRAMPTEPPHASRHTLYYPPQGQLISR